MSKTYTSIFIPEVKIDLANYITEILVCNFLTWQKRPRPTTPFWRKDVAKDDNLKKLAKLYNLELIGVKQLMKVFDPYLIAKFFVQKKVVLFKSLTKPKQQELLYNLFYFQVKEKSDTTPSLYDFENLIDNNEDYKPKASFNIQKTNILI